MKKIVLGAGVGIVVLAAAVVWLFPPLTYDLAPFLWRSHHQERIKQRTRTLLEHLRNGNTEGAIELTDPAYVRQHGTNLVGLRFEVLACA